MAEPRFQDAGGAAPWCQLFLNHRPNQFVFGYAHADGVSLATLGSNGKVSTGPVVQADTSQGRPSDLCWMAITLDDRLVFATMTGYGYITSWLLDDNVLSIAKDPACPAVPGEGTFRGIADNISSSPNDNWLTSDGAYLYQIYANACKLVGYAVRPDGSLDQIPARSFRTTVRRVWRDFDCSVGACLQLRCRPSVSMQIDSADELFLRLSVRIPC